MLLAAFIGVALGADLEGYTVPPASGDARDPIAAVSPWLLPTKAATAGLLLDGAWLPLMAIAPGQSWEDPAVGALLGAQLQAGFSPSRRLSLALTARTRLLSQQLDDLRVADDSLAWRGPSLSDLRLWAPIGLVQTPGAALMLSPHLDLGLSDAQQLDGRGHGGGLRLAGGLRGGAWQGQGELGVEAHLLPDGTPLRAPLGVSARLGAGWQGGQALALVSELEARRVSATVGPAAEARLLARLGGGRWQASLGLGLPLSAAPTVPLVRGLVGLRWVPPPAPETSAPLHLGPGDLRVELSDPSGAPLQPRVQVDGAEVELRPLRGGGTGLELEPGVYRIGVQAEGHGRQERLVQTAAEGATLLAATLLPGQGEAEVRLQVLDPTDRPVQDATLTVDGVRLGEAGIDGALLLGGLAAEAELQVQAEAPWLLSPQEPARILPSEAAPIYLDRTPGQVWLRVQAAGQPVTDAAVRLLGPEARPALQLDPQGEARFTLPPGDWVVVVASPGQGLQERHLRLEEEDRGLTEVLIELRDAADTASLRVEVRDPDGRPVEGALLWMGEDELGRTSSGGVLRVEGLPRGSATLRLQAEGARPGEPLAIELVEGDNELVLPLRWLAGRVRVIARGPDGPLPEAQVRFLGAQPGPTLSLGPDGRLDTELPPGDWTAVVSAPALGVQTRELQILPDRTSLVLIQATLIDDEGGDRSLVLRVEDPSGRPVEGARVLLDGVELGRTSAGGHLQIDGLTAQPRTVRVEHPLHEDLERERVALASGSTEQRLSMAWRLGLLEIQALAGDEPVDALVRLVGPASFPPLSLGPTGLRRIAAPPGDWSVVGSSERHGVQSAQVLLAPKAAGQRVELLYGEASAPRAIGDLPTRPVRLRTVRAAGGDLVGAAVRLYGEAAVPMLDTAPGGEIELALRPGGWTAIASAPELGLDEQSFVVPLQGEVPEVRLSLGAANLVEEGSVLRFLQQVRFATNEATLLPESVALLEEVVRTLRVQPSIRRVEIQGHSDDVGTEAFNLDLSQRRAEAVRAYLVQAGVAPARLSAQGYGLSRPKEPNTTEAGRAANRRVELHILETTAR